MTGLAPEVAVQNATVGVVRVTSATSFTKEASARVEVDFRPGHARDALRLLCAVVLEVILAAKSRDA